MLGAVKSGSAAGRPGCRTRAAAVCSMVPVLESVFPQSMARGSIFHSQDIALMESCLTPFILCYSTATIGVGKIFIFFLQDSNPHQVTPGTPQRGQKGRIQRGLEVWQCLPWAMHFYMKFKCMQRDQECTANPSRIKTNPAF